ncbi:MAG: winged helix-turn-helix transcriptional regulator [Elusimicrobia bacterium]|nr:winged helix-turn-helix transcriptional regulator [Elusimicrobiota bacterium]
MSASPSIDRMFKAFADGTRLRVLHLLAKGELCVCDIMAVLGAPQPKVSRHLSYLKRAGLVTVRREGAWRHYSLARPTGTFHERLVGCLDACLDEVPALRRDAAKLAAVRRKGCR